MKKHPYVEWSATVEVFNKKTEEYDLFPSKPVCAICSWAKDHPYHIGQKN